MKTVWRCVSKVRAGPRRAPRWITSDIAVWAAGEGSSWQRVHDAGVRSAVDLRTAGERGSGAEIVPPGLALRHFPIDDYGVPGLADLVEVSDWVVGQIAAGSRVVIGCREGRSRSALVACAALMRLGYSPATAYHLVRRGQPHIALSDSQIMMLEELNRSSRAY